MIVCLLSAIQNRVPPITPATTSTGEFLLVSKNQPKILLVLGRSARMPIGLPPLCLDCLLWSWLRGWTIGLPFYRGYQQMPIELPPLCLDCLLWSWLRGWSVGLPIYRGCPMSVGPSGQAILQQSEQLDLLSNQPLL